MSKRALVAEDYEPLREGNAEDLRAMGFEVSEARDGFEAQLAIGAAVHEGKPFDLLVLDNNMGGPDGIEILLCLRANGDETPAVLATGADPFTLQTWPTNATLLQKPYMASKLRQVVRDLLGLEPA